MTKFNKKPYRQTYEALMTPLTKAKMCSLLGSASANLDDPALREIINDFICSAQVGGFSDREAKIALHNIYNYSSFSSDLSHRIKGIQFYLEAIIDSDENADSSVSLFNRLYIKNKNLSVNCDLDDVNDSLADGLVEVSWDDYNVRLYGLGSKDVKFWIKNIREQNVAAGSLEKSAHSGGWELSFSSKDDATDLECRFALILSHLFLVSFVENNFDGFEKMNIPMPAYTKRSSGGE